MGSFHLIGSLSAAIVIDSLFSVLLNSFLIVLGALNIANCIYELNNHGKGYMQCSIVFMVLASEVKSFDLEDRAAIAAMQSYAVSHWLSVTLTMLQLLLWQLYFPQTWYTYAVCFALYLLTIASNIVGMSKIRYVEHADKLPDYSSWYLMLFYLFAPLHVIMISNANFEMFEALTENMLRTNEINYVLNHLSESIIMLKCKQKEYSVEFVNDRFLYAF